jgi:hypothetical protein
MLELANKVMNEYCTLVVKMALDFVINNFAKVNFELLCDIKDLYGLAFLLPLLKDVNNLMKLAQIQNVFVVDYLVEMKLCQTNLFSHFVDFDIVFKFDVFYSFKSLVSSSMPFSS